MWTRRVFGATSRGTRPVFGATSRVEPYQGSSSDVVIVCSYQFEDRRGHPVLVLDSVLWRLAAEGVSLKVTF